MLTHTESLQKQNYRNVIKWTKMLKLIHNKRNAIKTTLEEYFSPIKLEKNQEVLFHTLCEGATGKQAVQHITAGETVN